MTYPPFRINEVVDNTSSTKVLPGPSRVVAICAQTSRVWFIALPSRTERKPLRQQAYLKGPFAVPFVTCEQWKAGHQIYTVQLKEPATLELSDKNLLASIDEKLRPRVERDLKLRDQRYEIVATVLSSGDDRKVALTATEALSDMERLREGIRRAANIHNVTRTTARHLVHLFWAGGSQLNSLMPRFERCGLRGHSKTSSKKLGRPRRLFKQGLTSNPGFSLT
jgi:hypothetical protein